MIAEGTPTEENPYADQVVHFNSAFYTDAVSTSGNISDDSHMVEISGNKYKLGAYDTNNSLYASQKDTEYTITFAEQVSTSELHLLYTSAGGDVKVRVNYTDGTSDESTVTNKQSTTIKSSETYSKILSRVFIQKFTINPPGKIVENCIALMEMNIAADFNKKVKSLTVIPQSNANHFYLAASYKAYKLTGLEEIATEKQTSNNTPIIYPNPVRQGETIKVITSGASEVSFISLTGSVIYQVPTVNEIAEIPVNVSSGVYIVAVKDENGVKTAKIIVK